MKHESSSLAEPDWMAAFWVISEIASIDHLAQVRFERLRPMELTYAQFGVLNIFARIGGPRTPAWLANVLHVTRGAMTHTLSGLESRGFIVIAKNRDDRRAKLVSITPGGMAARDQALKILAPEFLALVRKIDRDRLAAALPFLADLRRFMSETKTLP